MLGSLSYKTKQFFLLLIKLSIVVGALYFIHQKLTSNIQLQLDQFVRVLIKSDLFLTKNLLFLLFLSIFNWFLEIKKWQHLVSFFKIISFSQAIKQTLASLTTSIFTPNRIGEYGAKVAFYGKQHRKKVLLMNLLGNMAQMGATVFFGSIGFLIFLSTYDHNITSYKLLRGFVLLIMIVGFLMIVYKNDRIQVRGYSLKDILNYFRKIPLKTHEINISLSLVRYLAFSFQLFILLNFFGIDISYYDAMVLITSYYFLVSVIPTIFILDLAVKGSVALYFFGFVTQDYFSVLSVILTMWILNFALPSIFGCFYVMGYKMPKSIQGEH